MDYRSIAALALILLLLVAAGVALLAARRRHARSGPSHRINLRREGDGGD